MDLIELSARVHFDKSADLARILLLLSIFSGKTQTKSFEGLTKLAKVDFLLRYPVYLERALVQVDADSSKVDVQEYERNAIESKMIRYKYGPWDPKHRALVNILKSMNLVTIKSEKFPVINLTEKGKDVVTSLQKMDEFADVIKRAKLVYRHFNKSGKWLKEFIYKAFPEILTLDYGEEIMYE
ncbi:MAG: hypothetical protein ACFFER_08235 [Candidatus Thorarchaeota archaeon]